MGAAIGTGRLEAWMKWQPRGAVLVTVVSARALPHAFAWGGCMGVSAHPGAGMDEVAVERWSFGDGGRKLW